MLFVSQIIEKTTAPLYYSFMAWDKKYYLNINDQNVGPLSFEEITDRLKNGLLKATDYIFITGNKDWQTINELQEFLIYIAPEDPEKRKSWFIRRNKQNEGPYSKQEIFQMIEAGKTDINDYVWSKELRNWTTIKEAMLIPDKENTTNTDQKTEPKTEDNKIIEEETPRPTAKKKDIDDVTPVAPQNYNPQKQGNMMLPEIILGISLIAIGIYQSSTRLVTSIVISFVGAGLLMLAFFEKRKGL